MRLPDPSSMPKGPRRFVTYLLVDFATGFHKRGWFALVPLTTIFSVSAGILVATYASPKLWDDMSNVIALYAAGLAVNAILLAICWAAFSRIMDILSDEEFGGYMRHIKMAQYYGFYVDFIHLTQMFAVAAMAAGLFSSLVGGLRFDLDRVILGLAVGSSVFAARWATGCVEIMQQLSDYRVQFRKLDGQVTTLHGRNSSSR